MRWRSLLGACALAAGLAGCTGLSAPGGAGGFNPQLHVGDVTVPARWGQYLEVLMARETAQGRYTAPPLSDLAGVGDGDGENERGTFMGIAADNSAKVVLAFLEAMK